MHSVMAVLANRHRESELPLINLSRVETGLCCQDVIKGRELVRPAWA